MDSYYMLTGPREFGFWKVSWCNQVLKAVMTKMLSSRHFRIMLTRQQILTKCC